MSKTYAVYILTNYNQTTFYVGVTGNLHKRIWEHKNKFAEGFTKKYNVDKLQFLYIAHDIVSSQAETYAEMLECVKSVKRSLDSRHNPFFFITTSL